MDEIKVIGFDLGYTLVYNTRAQIYMDFLVSNGITADEKDIKRAFHLADKQFMREYQGVLGKHVKTYFPWYLGIVNYQLGYKFNLIEQTAFHFSQTVNWKPYPWTRNVLQSLKNSGYTLVLLSNWDKGARGLLHELNLISFFDHVLISAEEGVEKPDPRIFKRLLEVTGAEPTEVLYVGDNYYDDVIGSRKVGIDTYLINPSDKLGIHEIADCTIIESTQELLTMPSIRTTGLITNG